MLIAKVDGKIKTSYDVYEEYTKNGISTGKLEIFDPWGENKLIYVRKSFAGAMPHFRHQKRPDWYIEKFGAGGESDTHKEIKKKILFFLKSKKLNVIDEDYKSFDAKRIPDISVFNDQKKVSEVHEIQKSVIPLNDIIERTEFYLENGVTKVVWYFVETNKSNWKKDEDLINYFINNEFLEIVFVQIQQSTEWIDYEI